MSHTSRLLLALGLALPSLAMAEAPWSRFLKNRGFNYGHDQLNSTATQGGMFPTWFRTLTLAYLGKALPESSVGKFDWKFCNCPGIQFWEVEHR